MLRKRPVNSPEEEDNLKSSSSKKTKSNTKSRSFIFILLLLVIFVLYVVVPLSVYTCPAVRRHAVFLNYVSLSRQKNLSLPSESGLKCTKNFYIKTGDDIKVGVWHVPPQSALSKCKDVLPDTLAFKDNRPVFLYLHGNAGTRAGHHRVELYKLLSEKVDVHVLAFDYRGFGDSSNVSPTEEGVVEDTMQVYNWLLQRVNVSRIFVWGHSLGTGVGVAFLERLSNSRLQKPAALILEAPFTRIIDAARHHPLSIFHRYMPFFDMFIAQPIGDKETGFNSIDRIDRVKCPLLILHAEDDGFVPFDHGKKLYDVAVVARKSSPSHETRFVGFDKKYDLGHKDIYKSPDLPKIIQNFIKSVDSGLV